MSDSLDQLTAKLLDSYAEVGGINHQEGVNLPDKQTVEALTRQLLHLLFPGFFTKNNLSGDLFEKATRTLLEEVCGNLEREVVKSLEYAPPPGLKVCDYSETAREKTCQLMQCLPRIRETLSTDVQAALDGDPAAASMEEIILAYPGLEAIAVQRVAHELHQLGVALIPRMMTEWAHARTGIDIHPGARIGSSFFIDHGTGVVIGETCVIGNQVKIYHGVTLGARSTSGGQQLRHAKRHPTIEDQVTIYPGATILGGETVIGRGSTIGGNVFLLHSVPERSLVYYEEGAVLVKSKSELGRVSVDEVWADSYVI
ncbi:MAG: serine acetyltransferase [Blastochloris sp.]|nr:serine acetyltransferase [Blastochloris sp.]